MVVYGELASTDIEVCVSFVRDAFRPVYVSMDEIYGPELFRCLRPDWENVEAESIRELCSDNERKQFVATSDGQPVGLLVASIDRDTGMGGIDVVIVHPRHQRRGIANALMSNALDWLSSNGCCFVQAFIRQFAGHEPICRLLERAGFDTRAVQPTLLFSSSLEAGQNPTHAHIRPLVDADVEGCVRFGLEAFRPIYTSFEDQYGSDLFRRLEPNWETAQSDYIRDAITAPSDETFVFVDDGRPVGFVVVRFDDHQIGDIELLAVDPTAQGKRIGAALNRKALARCAEHGMKYCFVATANDPGHAPARRSYERVGFIAAPIQWNIMIRPMTPHT
jgi:GNAT superfamily N-acetyltransferase